MDETRIPKCVEKITRLDPDKPVLLFRRKAKKGSKKAQAFRDSVKDAMLAIVEIPRRGTEAIIDQMPDAGGKGDMIEQVSSRIIKLRKRGMKMLRGK